MLYGYLYNHKGHVTLNEKNTALENRVQTNQVLVHYCVPYRDFVRDFHED